MTFDDYQACLNALFGRIGSSIWCRPGLPPAAPLAVPSMRSSSCAWPWCNASNGWSSNMPGSTRTTARGCLRASGGAARS